MGVGVVIPLVAAAFVVVVGAGVIRVDGVEDAIIPTQT
jgi:hypothetical protein